MEHNVYSFRVAILKGYQLHLYTYNPQQIPTGEFVAIFDYKIWSKRIIAINCYFTKMNTGERFVVTVYCNKQTGKYTVPGSTIDFSHCQTGLAYRVIIFKNDRGKIILSKAEYCILTDINK